MCVILSLRLEKCVRTRVSMCAWVQCACMCELLCVVCAWVQCVCACTRVCAVGMSYCCGLCGLQPGASGTQCPGVACTGSQPDEFLNHPSLLGLSASL